ncbi:MAG: YbaN family protein [Dehalococcoidia bacterium]|nr:YbaN family protein [Dehalococcoidia bacterium]
MEDKKSKYLIIRILLIILGSIFVAIGAIGILVPGLPTTPFMILAAACYIRSSNKLYNWLIKNKLFGKHIKNIREGKGIPIRVKIFAQVMMTTFIFLAIIPFSPISVPNLFIKIIIFLAGLTSFWYVAYRVPTLKE